MMMMMMTQRIARSTTSVA